MNKLAYYQGYISKEAAITGGDLLRGIVKYPGALIGAPIAGGYLGGRAYSSMKEPTNQEVSTLQAQYVRDKITQAIEDLEKRKKIERLQEMFGGHSSTLRI